MIKLYAIKIKKDLDRNTFNELFHLIDAQKRKRVENYYFEKDAWRSLLGDLLMRFMLIKNYRVKNHDIHFELNPFGKPFIRNIKGCYFNISHSGEWVVGIIGNYPVGIDVEKIKEMDMNIARRFFSQDEISALFNQSKKERLPYFFELWTAKEAYIKALGQGLSISLSSFSVNTDLGEVVNENGDRWLIAHIFLDDGYKLAACSSSPFKETIIEIVTIQDIVNMLINNSVQ